MNSSDSENTPLPIDSSGEVPVFSCIAYVASAAGGIRVRVANLPGLSSTAESERAALAKLVPAFKQRIQEHLARGEAIPWVEPPEPPAAGEQRRFIPVHL